MVKIRGDKYVRSDRSPEIRVFIRSIVKLGYYFPREYSDQNEQKAGTIGRIVTAPLYGKDRKAPFFIGGFSRRSGSEI